MTDASQLVRATLAAFEAGDRRVCMAHIRQLLDAEAPLGATWRQLARLTSVLAESSLSIACARRYAAFRPDDPTALLEEVGALMKFSKVADAQIQAQRIIARNPGLASAHYQLGLCHAQLNKTDAALESLRRAITLEPRAGDAWIVLATIKKFAHGDSDFQRLTAVLAQTPQPRPETRGALLLALGKALEDLGDYRRAFAAFEEAARIFAAQTPFDIRQDEAQAQALQTFDAAFAARLTPTGPPSDRPIFVFGLPRSGTTLIEQILTAHSQVADGGEINLALPAIFGLDSGLPREIIAYTRARRGDEPWRRFGEDYLHLLEDRFGPNGRIVDKTLNTSRLLGVIAAMLPSARMIWLQRDPGDVAISAFKTRLLEGAEWSWSLPLIARHIRAEERMHTHWTALYGDRILTVPYADLTGAPDLWIPRILAHCGLADERGTRMSHETPRAVHTASMAQVRRPISTSAVGAWRRYEQQMAPFWSAYRV